MIERARRDDPRVVLGVAPGAGPAAARAAFHALCKRYHPARFARSSPETVRLANEAFLAIKRAYDGILKPEPAKPEPAIAAGTVPIQARPIEKPAPAPRPAPAPAKPTEKLPASALAPRPAPAVKPTEKLSAQARPTPAAMPVPPRPGTEKLPAQPAPPAPPATEEQRFTLALDLLRRRMWRDAEKALGELAVEVPAERKYRAYRHYARGRLAQDDGRLDDARGEWERALRLEPELHVARAAIDALPEPPKPSGGGLLSKLFKR